LERLTSRITAGVANPRELLALRDSLLAIPELHTLLGGFSGSRLAEIRERLDGLGDVVALIQNAIADDPPNSINELGIIRAGHSTDLDELRAIRASSKEYLASLEARERKRTGIHSLKVRYNQVFGYFIEVTRSNLSQVPADYVRKQTLVSCERFVTEELLVYEEKVLHAEERLYALEKEIFARYGRRLPLRRLVHRLRPAWLPRSMSMPLWPMWR